MLADGNDTVVEIPPNLLKIMIQGLHIQLAMNLFTVLFTSVLEEAVREVFEKDAAAVAAFLLRRAHRDVI